MKRIYPSKLMVFFLLAVFLLASVGTVFGYSWCVGDDGHVEVSYAKDSGCCVDDLNNHPADRFDVSTLSKSNGDACGLCLDFTAQKYDAVFFKRVKRVPTLSVATLSSAFFTSNASLTTQKVEIPLVSHSPPRVSQTILAHRTIVLLT